jgi:hypothetical protein
MYRIIVDQGGLWTWWNCRTKLFNYHIEIPSGVFSFTCWYITQMYFHICKSCITNCGFILKYLGDSSVIWAFDGSNPRRQPLPSTIKEKAVFEPWKWNDTAVCSEGCKREWEFGVQSGSIFNWNTRKNAISGDLLETHDWEWESENVFVVYQTPPWIIEATLLSFYSLCHITSFYYLMWK